MKIITQGKIPEPEPAWWTLTPIKCSHCHTVFQLEAGDVPNGPENGNPNNRKAIVVPCPLCKTRVRYEKPVLR